MDRYLAFLWDAAVDAQTAQVRRWCDSHPVAPANWRSVYSQRGLQVFVRGDGVEELRATRLADDLGVGVGSLFERGKERDGRVDQLSHEASRAIVRTDGAALIDGYWGNYVALWCSPRGVKVLRDPCGALPCYYMHCNGVTILCSHIPDIAELEGLHVSTDWNALQAFLLHSYFITSHTALKEVHELLPGQQMSWSIDHAPRFAWRWNASAIAGSPRMQSFDDTQANLRETAESCFQALGNTHGNIVVRMSGGLDSSIVAALARQSSAHSVTGVHLIGRGYERHELALARLAARHVGIDLLELDVGSASFDLAQALGAPKTPRPTRQIFAGAANALLLDLCRDAGARCVMAGHGGDSLFLQRSISTSAFADYLFLRGLGPDFWRVAYENASLIEASIWSVLRDGFMHRTGLKAWKPLAFLEQADSASPPTLHAAFPALPPSYMLHDWVQDARALPPCKAEQVRGITALRNYHAVLGHGLSLDAVHPLISQPIVEFCLRTPSYLFGHGGGDRTLERRAFADLLPGEVVRRVHKGFITHRLVEDMSRIAGTLRAFLSDGYLVSEGGLARDFVERIFTSDHMIDGARLDTLLDLIAAEAWLAAWRERPSGRGI